MARCQHMRFTLYCAPKLVPPSPMVLLGPKSSRLSYLVRVVHRLWFSTVADVADGVLLLQTVAGATMHRSRIS